MDVAKIVGRVGELLIIIQTTEPFKHMQPLDLVAMLRIAQEAIEQGVAAEAKMEMLRNALKPK